MKIKLSLILLLGLSGFFVQAQNYQDSLDQKLQAFADTKALPGFAVAIMRDGKMQYAKGFGWADMADRRSFTTQSIQNIGSISKTFIGVALMKAQSLGLLLLDDPIDKYLPYKIVNPRFPDRKITIRHLASHTASLKDPDAYEHAYIFKEKIDIPTDQIPKDYKKYIKLYNNNQRVGLDEFIKSVYYPGGIYYKKKNFLKVGPGEQFNYSNIGAAMAARVLEFATKMSFVDFTQKHIFDPIGMNNTSWELDKVDLSQKTTPYLSPGISIPHYDLITFADGGLITSVEDLSKYIMEMMKCRLGNGTLLSKELCNEMMRPYLKNNDQPYGVFWETTKSGKSIGHNGGDPGTATNMYFQPETGVAKIMFINMIPYDKKSGEIAGKTWRTLREYELLIKN